MAHDFEDLTPREVLDGDWVDCWEALKIADERLKDEAVYVTESTGQLLARMAASGYLPTISNEVSHTQPIPEGEPDVMAMTEAEQDEHFERKAKEVEEERKKAKWQLVDPALWGSVFGYCSFENKRVHLSQPSFRKSSIIATYTVKKYERREPLWIVMNDPGFHLLMARNILVYKDGLYSTTRVASGFPDPDDLYDYSKLDLSNLNLPKLLPLSKRDREFAERKDRLTKPASKGRPGGKNGEPIAVLTIKLMGLPEDQLQSYTAEAAGAELQDFFEMLGTPARNIDNCRKDAAGVLRQVRSARGLG